MKGPRAGSNPRFKVSDRLHITVLDAQGTILGTEDVVLRLKTRRYLAFDRPSRRSRRDAS